MPRQPDRLSPYQAEPSLDRTPAQDVLDELVRLGAPERDIAPGNLRPMLAESQEQPFNAPGWYFELKLDGYRALALRDTTTRLLSRNGNDLSACFPEIVEALEALPFGRGLLDGELV